MSNFPKAPSNRPAGPEGYANRPEAKRTTAPAAAASRRRVLRPTPPARPASGEHPPSGFESSDPTGTKGNFKLLGTAAVDVIGRSESADAKTWAGLPGGSPNPRQRAQRGENVVSPAKTSDAGGGLTVPAPIE